MSEDPVRSPLLADVDQALKALEAAAVSGNPQRIAVARLAYARLHERWWQDVERRLDAIVRKTPRAGPALPATLAAHIYPAAATADGPPDVAVVPTPGGVARVGVCISGGGSRSLSAAMGQLRGLRHLGLLDKVTYLSTVSGGTWGSLLYTYLPPVIPDDELLGEVVPDPASLRWDSSSGPDPAADLSALSSHAMGSVPTRIGIAEFLAKMTELREQRGVPADRLWARAIGALIFEPFGLGDLPPRGFSWTPAWLEKVVLAGNPGLAASDFALVNPGGRPFHIVNATLFYPPAATRGPFRPGRDAGPYPFEATPITTGIPPAFPYQGAPVPGQPTSRDLGGGWVDPFAWGGDAPATPPTGNRISLATPSRLLALSDLASTSGAAFVGPLIETFGSQFSWLEDLVPVYRYWPVLDTGTGRDGAWPYIVGDGGNLEDTGIAALLRRRVPRIIAFVNAERSLALDSLLDQVIIDGQVPPLFGLAPAAPGQPYRPYPADATSPFRFDQVFPAARFEELLHGLWDGHRSGGSAICQQTSLPVLPCPRLGVAGGFTVDVLWVYTNPVTSWKAALHESVRFNMDVLHHIEFRTFPNYDTILQLRLTPQQVNLLAHLSCWNVINDRPVGGRPSNAQLFREMFEKGNT
jgi:hypothetical protein